MQGDGCATEQPPVIARLAQLLRYPDYRPDSGGSQRRHSAVRQSAGKVSQSQRPGLETVTFGAASGDSTKQPPAMPVRPAWKADFQNSVVPQLAQNQRCCG